jgi:hypothetical protein
MARVSCCSRCVVKTEEEEEEEEFILTNCRPEIGPHAKTEEETEWNTGMGLPRRAAPRRRSLALRSNPEGVRAPWKGTKDARENWLDGTAVETKRILITESSHLITDAAAVRNVELDGKQS